MELIILILFVLLVALFYKVRKLDEHLTVLSFSFRNISKLLVKKKFIQTSEIDAITNESIGDMPEDDGNELIKSAKSMGITIPEYMDAEKLKRYTEKQESERKKRETSFTDRMMMEE